ncbi:MAG: orotidine-5'-phosphate decarboxylase [Betaproteobacteria bacterium]|nr:orotidine-5'-phosphate decarboxylase [Betaproteobacteria bacterium]
MNGPRVIVALDFPDARAALDLARRLDPARCRVKVGKELFTAAGPALVEALRERGFEIFLDLKFHDIPNTVASACRAAAALGVWMINVHALGGRAMLHAARDAIEGMPQRPLLTAVTVLTSLSAPDLPEIGLSGTPEENVLRLAGLAQAAGLDGVVCSAQEARALRAALGEGFVLVTPGIRMADDAAGDQSRVVTPRAAIEAGATYLVVGRPVTRAVDPATALARILTDLGPTRSEGG